MIDALPPDPPAEIRCADDFGHLKAAPDYHKAHRHELHVEPAAFELTADPGHYTITGVDAAAASS